MFHSRFKLPDCEAGVVRSRAGFDIGKMDKRIPLSDLIGGFLSVPELSQSPVNRAQVFSV